MSWWSVCVGDRADESLADRIYFAGRRYVATWKLRERRRYLLEDLTTPRSGITAARRALERAATDGLLAPVVLSSSRCRYQIQGGRVVDL